ncbi:MULTISPECIES: alpha/beta hydrolase [unclassified Brevibacterium]|uniref:alpha/beta fold hydrolase n=1 Tax=unclassified Brevibacterium TaxID=2614124 RepID=UPI002017041F|nr:alpha/beta hydrolase [Brevibacterium sp. 2SA]MCM1013607.1 alpha/beta hydrolase [Brevibacterium sp. XM4083]
MLLHGWPQTASCWRDVIPGLYGPDADTQYHVIAPDLRGYGLSDKPTEGYDKRSMSRDILGIMDSFGVDRAHFVGHDRGGRVAHRLALDSPERVSSLAVLDIAPTHAMFTNGRMRTAEGFFHWLLHMQKDLPETLTAGRTAEYLRYFFERWTVRRDRLEPHIDDYVRAFEKPGAMRAGFDDYRATHEDVALDDEDFRAQRKLTVPVLALWGAGGLAANTDITTVWESYTENLDGRPIPDCGHFIPEEAPETLLSALREFWSQSA